MPTIYTHAVVGLGIGQLYLPQRRWWLYLGLATLLPVVPDFDVLSDAPSNSSFGHRGITHSLLFALWLAFFAATLTFRPCLAKLWVLTGMFFVAIASHGLLDAMNKGDMPIPLFWPAIEERFGSWGLIPVADLGFEWPDPRRSRTLRFEMLWIWLPVGVLIALTTAVRIVRWRRGLAKEPAGMP